MTAAPATFSIGIDSPVTIESRWTMSYLRGPLTRDQTKKLMDPVRSAFLTPPKAGTQTVAPASVSATSDKTVIGSASIRYNDVRNKIDHEADVSFVAPLNGRTNAPDWEQSSPASGSPQGEPPAANLAARFQENRAFSPDTTTPVATRIRLTVFATHSTPCTLMLTTASESPINLAGRTLLPQGVAAPSDCIAG
jgi:hypothetical protein